jgi:hypothetical protein
VQDLQQISSAVEVYYMRHQRLPVTLEELSREPGLSRIAADPITGQPYGYRGIDSNSYELCGAFDRETTDVRSASIWSHGSGMQCFTLKVTT